MTSTRLVVLLAAIAATLVGCLGGTAAPTANTSGSGGPATSATSAASSASSGSGTSTEGASSGSTTAGTSSAAASATSSSSSSSSSAGSTSGSSSSSSTGGSTGLSPICASCGADEDCASGFCNIYALVPAFCDGCLQDSDCASGGVACNVAEAACECPQVTSGSTGGSGSTGTSSGCATPACATGDSPSSWVSDSPSWSAETGYTLAFALDACGAPNLVYDEPVNGSWVVRHAARNSSTTWSVETVLSPNVGDAGTNSYALAMALDSNGAAHVLRQAFNESVVGEITNASGTWAARSFPIFGSAQGGEAMTTNPSGQVLASLVVATDAGVNAIEFARLASGNWIPELVPSTTLTPDFGSTTSITSDGHTVFITVPSFPGGAELARRWEDGGWTVSQINPAMPRNSVAIALDTSSTPHLAYGRPYYSSAQNYTDSDLVSSQPAADGGWAVSVAALAGYAQQNAYGIGSQTSAVSLALRGDGGLDIAYLYFRDSTDETDLRLASFPGGDGGWVLNEVEDGEWPENIQMARDPSGHLLVATTSDQHGPVVYTEGCR